MPDPNTATLAGTTPSAPPASPPGQGGQTVETPTPTPGATGTEPAMVPSHVLRERTEAHRKELSEQQSRYQAAEERSARLEQVVALYNQYLESMETPPDGAAPPDPNDPVARMEKRLLELERSLQGTGAAFAGERDALAKREARNTLRAKYPQIAQNDDLMRAVGKMARSEFHSARSYDEKVAAIEAAAEALDGILKMGGEQAFSRAEKAKAAAVETGQHPVPKGKMPDLADDATPEQVQANMIEGMRRMVGVPPEE